jgi:hypothetical protein
LREARSQAASGMATIPEHAMAPLRYGTGAFRVPAGRPLMTGPHSRIREEARVSPGATSARV